MSVLLRGISQQAGEDLERTDSPDWILAPSDPGTSPTFPPPLISCWGLNPGFLFQVQHGGTACPSGSSGYLFGAGGTHRRWVSKDCTYENLFLSTNQTIEITFVSQWGNLGYQLQSVKIYNGLVGHIVGRKNGSKVPLKHSKSFRSISEIFYKNKDISEVQK